MRFPYVQQVIFSFTFGSDVLQNATGINLVEVRQTLIFLSPAPPFTARDTLKAWQEKNHPWLELSDVHRETTENIRVTVIPFYMGMRVNDQHSSRMHKSA